MKKIERICWSRNANEKKKGFLAWKIRFGGEKRTDWKRQLVSSISRGDLDMFVSKSSPDRGQKFLVAMAVIQTRWIRTNPSDIDTSFGPAASDARYYNVEGMKTRGTSEIERSSERKARETSQLYTCVRNGGVKTVRASCQNHSFSCLHLHISYQRCWISHSTIMQLWRFFHHNKKI